MQLLILLAILYAAGVILLALASSDLHYFRYRLLICLFWPVPTIYAIYIAIRRSLRI
ncbi:MAG: hypothetical protein MN733_23865 [Nitrososphaera sp.]|nr:hypothetical protein [Nitrososphaera sp.]